MVLRAGAGTLCGPPERGGPIYRRYDRAGGPCRRTAMDGSYRGRDGRRRRGLWLGGRLHFQCAVRGVDDNGIDHLGEWGSKWRKFRSMDVSLVISPRTWWRLTPKTRLTK